jgi:hypothetical protein
MEKLWRVLFLTAGVVIGWYATTRYPAAHAARGGVVSVATRQSELVVATDLGKVYICSRQGDWNCSEAILHF